ncbi:MAG: DUF4129 domain-containing protein [Planctomycetales bacterium]
MPRARRDKTLADYVVIALSPALIMTLVGSLVFFLLDVSYKGQYELRMRWIMFWFVMGAVLVARIAIEEGKEHARLFGVALCAVVAFGVMRFVDQVAVAWVLLAVVWWCASKLTWDCTLIDDDEDASGEGLLQAAGLGGAPAVPPPPPVPAADTLPDDAATRKSRPHAPGLWVVYFSLAALPLFGVGQLFVPAQEGGRRQYAFLLLAVYVASALALLLTTSFLGLRRYLRQRKLAMPVAMTGAWMGMGTLLLVALLLAALLIPRPQGEYTLTALVDKLDAQVRDASKMAVLPGDKGAGEGRPIGQQDPQAKQPGGQPADKQPGAPGGDGRPGNQPQGEPAQDQAGGKEGGSKKGEQPGSKKSDPGQTAGKDATGKPDAKRDPAHPEEKQPPGQKPDNPPQGQQQVAQQQPPLNDPRNPQAPPQAGPPKQGQPPPGGAPPQGKPAEGGQAQRPAEAAPKPPIPATPPTPPSSNWLGSLAPFFKWILYGVLALVGLWLLFRHWRQVVEFLARLWAELLSLFGRRPEATSSTAESEAAAIIASKRPFADYPNPFATGAASKMSATQLVRYTFEALEAWAREQVVERPPEQTPLEFAQELGRRVPPLAKDVSQTAQFYANIAYARKAPPRDSVETLERLWRKL